ncbi:hypothetical protein [uncultured Amphritea sp.]|uniref:EF-hand domain-containing protein n=1 Tax=uncultured Amphritea sp. TaxID=981605 RepID=UPI00260AF5B6|nr:hypothetical protein [uncultured Amphritea sp.]
MKTRLRVKLFPVSALLSIATGCLFAFAAQAADIPAQGPIPFAIYDQDGNGVISQEEFDDIRNMRIQNNAAAGAPMRGMANAPAFSDLDSNGDGQLSAAELQTAQAAQRNMKSQNQQMGPGNGMMGGGRNQPSFNEVDQDGDGFISQDEMNTFRNARITERVQAGYPMRNLANMKSFGDMDMNQDGMLDTDEFSQHQMQQRNP